MSRVVRAPVRALLPLLALGALGCEQPEPVVEQPLSDDLFWIEVTPDTSDPSCKTTVEHNFVDAVPIGEVDTTELTELERRVESAAGGYGYVTRQGDGRLLLNFQGTVYAGSFQDAGTIEVSWRGTVEYEESIEFADAYSFEGVGAEQLEEVVSLGSSGEPGAAFEGTLSVREFADVIYSETDEWDSSETGIFISSMPVDDFLEPTDGFGSVFNSAFLANCEGEPCRLDVVSDCTSTVTLTAWPVAGGLDAFLALDGYGRSSGVPDGVL